MRSLKFSILIVAIWALRSWHTISARKAKNDFFKGGVHGLVDPSDMRVFRNIMHEQRRNYVVRCCGAAGCKRAVSKRTPVGTSTATTPEEQFSGTGENKEKVTVTAGRDNSAEISKSHSISPKRPTSPRTPRYRTQLTTSVSSDDKATDETLTTEIESISIIKTRGYRTEIRTKIIYADHMQTGKIGDETIASHMGQQILYSADTNQGWVTSESKTTPQFSENPVPTFSSKPADSKSPPLISNQESSFSSSADLITSTIGKNSVSESPVNPTVSPPTYKSGTSLITLIMAYTVTAARAASKAAGIGTSKDTLGIVVEKANSTPEPSMYTENGAMIATGSDTFESNPAMRVSATSTESNIIIQSGASVSSESNVATQKVTYSNAGSNLIIQNLSLINSQSESNVSQKVAASELNSIKSTSEINSGSNLVIQSLQVNSTVSESNYPTTQNMYVQSGSSKSNPTTQTTQVGSESKNSLSQTTKLTTVTSQSNLAVQATKMVSVVSRSNNQIIDTTRVTSGSNNQIIDTSKMDIVSVSSGSNPTNTVNINSVSNAATKQLISSSMGSNQISQSILTTQASSKSSTKSTPLINSESNPSASSESSQAIQVITLASSSSGSNQILTTTVVSKLDLSGGTTLGVRGSSESTVAIPTSAVVPITISQVPTVSVTASIAPNPGFPTMAVAISGPTVRSTAATSIGNSVSSLGSSSIAGASTVSIVSSLTSSALRPGTTSITSAADMSSASSLNPSGTTSITSAADMSSASSLTPSGTTSKASATTTSIASSVTSSTSRPGPKSITTMSTARPATPQVTSSQTTTLGSAQKPAAKPGAVTTTTTVKPFLCECPSWCSCNTEQGILLKSNGTLTGVYAFANFSFVCGKYINTSSISAADAVPGLLETNITGLCCIKCMQASRIPVPSGPFECRVTTNNSRLVLTDTAAEVRFSHADRSGDCAKFPPGNYVADVKNVDQCGDGLQATTSTGEQTPACPILKDWVGCPQNVSSPDTYCTGDRECMVQQSRHSPDPTNNKCTQLNASYVCVTSTTTLRPACDCSLIKSNVNCVAAVKIMTATLLPRLKAISTTLAPSLLPGVSFLNGGTMYFLESKNNKTWFNALEFCRQYGMDLYQGDTDAEHTALTTKITSLGSPLIVVDYLIGGSLLWKGCTWTYVSGTPVPIPSPHWQPNNPADATQDLIQEIYGGTWWDTDYTRIWPFICEKQCS